MGKHVMLSAAKHLYRSSKPIDLVSIEVKMLRCALQDVLLIEVLLRRHRLGLLQRRQIFSREPQLSGFE